MGLQSDMSDYAKLDLQQVEDLALHINAFKLELLEAWKASGYNAPAKARIKRALKSARKLQKMLGKAIKS